MHVLQRDIVYYIIKSGIECLIRCRIFLWLLLEFHVIIQTINQQIKKLEFRVN
jgi:hypothetical protein